MNEFSYRVVPLISGGFKAYLRLASDGEPKPLMGKGGKPIIYRSEVEALRAITDNLCRYINGHLVRDGETLSSRAVKQAEALFPTLVKQRGKERRIPVVLKGSKGNGKR